jgi:hypothetical protein
VISWTQPVDAEEIVLRTVGRRETKDDILAKRLAYLRLWRKHALTRYRWRSM